MREQKQIYSLREWSYSSCMQGIHLLKKLLSMILTINWSKRRIMQHFGRPIQGAGLLIFSAMFLRMFLLEWLLSIQAKDRRWQKSPNILGSIAKYALNRKSNKSLKLDCKSLIKWWIRGEENNKLKEPNEITIACHKIEVSSNLRLHPSWRYMRLSRRIKGR